MYNKSFDDVINLIEANCLTPNEYHECLFKRLRDDDNYDIRYCIEHGITPDTTRFSDFEQFLLYVYQKCKCNIYYFLRNVIQLPMQGGGYMEFQLNIGTLSFIEHYLCGRNALLENPRQTFQTYTAICIGIYESLFRTHNASYIKLVSDTRTNDKILGRKFTEIINTIPNSFKLYVENHEI